mgnify:FL=1
MAKSTKKGNIKFLNAAVVKPLPENAPSWLVAKVGFNIPKLLEDLEQYKEDGLLNGDWLNTEIKIGRTGRLFMDIDDGSWKNNAKPKAKAKAKG